MKASLLLGLCTGLLLTTTACGDSDSNTFVPGIPGDPPVVSFSGVPATVTVGTPVNFSASVTAPSGLRTNDTFAVAVTGAGVNLPNSFFDVDEVPDCDAGDTFCSVTLTEIVGNPPVFEQTGTVTLTISAFDIFNASGSASATIVVQ